MRPLQLHFLRFFFPLIDSQDKLVPLSPEFKALCRAWASPFSKGSRLPPSAFSGCHHRRLKSRLGAVLRPHRVLGVWSKKEVLDHINSLDLKSVLLTLQNLESLVLGRSVLICSDFMTMVSFIYYQGGTHSSSLCRLALEGLDLWEWCLQRNIFPLGSSPSGRSIHFGGFSLQGKVFPFRMGPNSFSVSEVLPCIVSPSGDRLVQLPNPEVLLSVLGCSGLEDRRVVFSLDGSSPLRVSSLLSSP